MNSDIDLKALWQQQPDMPVPDKKELFSKAAKLKNKTRNKLITTNVLLILTSIFITFIGWSYHPKLVTTKIGILIMVIDMVAYLLVYNQLIPVLYKKDAGASTHEYLQQFIRIKKKQDFLNTTMLSIYYLLLSAGLFLYFIEVADRKNMAARLMTYAITSAWILFSWFYIRPRTIRKQRAAVDTMISKLQAIDDQLTNLPDDSRYNS